VNFDIIRQREFWTRESVQADPDRIYIFGDNEEGVGHGGQACIRGLDNAFGIPTLKAPGVFWSDEEIDANIAAIEAAIERIPVDRPWVISHEGLGTGLAELPARAPATYRYLVGRITAMEQERHALPPDWVLVLRSSDIQRKAYGGFQYPEFGWVECADFDSKPRCGGGLHALLNGVGDYSLLNLDPDAVWQVIAVDPETVVSLDGGAKVKFPGGHVIYTGTKEGAVAHFPNGRDTAEGYAKRASAEGLMSKAEARGTRSQASSSGYGSQASSSGDGSQASSSGTRSQASSSGYGSQASSSGYGSQASSSGDGSQASSSGYGSQASSSGTRSQASSSGYGSQASSSGRGGIAISLGHGGKAMADENGCIAITWWDAKKERPRLAVGYVGEKGIKKETWYAVDLATGKLVEVE
jgi:hypothetical protein